MIFPICPKCKSASIALRFRFSSLFLGKGYYCRSCEAELEHTNEVMALVFINLVIFLIGFVIYFYFQGIFSPTISIILSLLLIGVALFAPFILFKLREKKTGNPSIKNR